MLAKMDSFQKEMKDIITNQTKTDATLKEMKEELTAKLEAKIEDEIKTNNEKFEVLQSTLISQMDIYQAMREAIQEEIIAKGHAWNAVMELQTEA